MKRASLSAASESMASPRCFGLLAMRPNGRPFDADEGGHDARAKTAAQFEDRTFVGQRVDDVADLVDTQPVLPGSRGAAVAGPARSIRRPPPGSRRDTSSPPRRPPVRPRRERRSRRSAIARWSARPRRDDRRRDRRLRSSPARPCRRSCPWSRSPRRSSRARRHCRQSSDPTRCRREARGR